MLILERKGNEVYFEGKKLTINAQASKGPNQEVVKIEGLPNSNGQKWLSLSRLKEGVNEIEAAGRQVASRKYSLTPAEEAEVKELQARIDAIIEAAKARYVAPINLNKLDPSKMTEEEKAAAIEAIQAHLEALRAK